MVLNKSPLDKVLEYEAYVTSAGYVTPDSAAFHKRVLDGWPGWPTEHHMTPEMVVNEIHVGMTNFMAAKLRNQPEKLKREMEAFRSNTWPCVSKLIRENPLMAMHMLTLGIYSLYFATFVQDVAEGRLALGVLPGQWIGRLPSGELEVIPPDDGAFYCATHEKSLEYTRFRTVEFQKALKLDEAKNVLFLGGGLDPALWTRGFRLGERDQKIVMIDQVDWTPYWQQILGGHSLGEYGVEYHVGKIEEAIRDKSLHGMFDEVCLSGVASYFGERLNELLYGASLMLKPGGLLVWDLQVMHEVYVYEVRALGWPKAMTLEANAEVATERAMKACQDVRILFVKSVPQDDAPAGVVFWSRKPAA